MQPHQQRVIDEKTELDEKLSKLGTFQQGSLFASLPQEEQERMRRQSDAMTEYSKILSERIAAFV